jgi:UDP-N-acetylmuramoyl-L-alanyl-D-glutamate--2,6-diaminopimelate ligase
VGANAHYFVVTNEDPFDENPMDVINAVSEGAVEAGMVLGKNLFKIEDRKKAIEKAIQLARPGDLVLVTGKGNEQRMFMSGGKTIAWDDREVVRETLRRKT